jgi:DNA-binding response OmpR family regulator
MNTELRKSNREAPLVLLGGTDPAALHAVAGVMRREGMAIAGALGDRACLRVAAALSPDIILLDPRLPRTLLSLLRAHPLSKTAQISWSQALARPAGVASTSAAN